MFNINTLSNGLRVISSCMPGYNSVAINILVKVGSRYESRAEHGICHFLEHMAFKGTQKRTYSQIAQEFDTIGGQFNAYTSREYTVYHAKVLSSDLRTAMDILSDILLNSTFCATEIAKEKKVILQEIAQVADNPDELAYDNLIEAAFSGQALGRSILGTDQTLSTFTTQTFKDYIKTHYHAGNIVISVAGNIEHKNLIDLAEEFFATLPSGQQQNNDKPYYTLAHSKVSKDLEQVNMFLGFVGSPYTDQYNYYAAQVLSLLFGGGSSSRLFQNIREKHGLVYSVGSFNNAYNDIGLFCIYGSTTKDNAAEFFKQVQIEVQDVCKAIDSDELERAKKQIRASTLMAEEKAAYRSADLAKSFAIFGQYYPTSQILEQIDAFTVQDILNAAQRIFASKPSISVVGPEMDLDIDKINLSI